MTSGKVLHAAGTEISLKHPKRSDASLHPNAQVIPEAIRHFQAGNAAGTLDLFAEDRIARGVSPGQGSVPFLHPSSVIALRSLMSSTRKE